MSTSLQKELDAFVQQFKSTVPEEVFNSMVKANQDLAATGIEAKAPKVGDTLPEFELPIVAGPGAGGAFKLSEGLKKGPVVVVFYRGGWCPYCNLTLKHWKRNLPALKAKNATIVAISPEKPEVATEVASKNEIEFPVLWDRNLEVARNKFNIVFTLPENIQKLYGGFGVDLAGTQDRTDKGEGELPMPATFAAKPDGKIVFSFAPAFYSRRADAADVLATL